MRRNPVEQRRGKLHAACAQEACGTRSWVTNKTHRRLLSFPLERHFEQCIHVRNRLHNYCADCSVRFHELATDELAERALAAMRAPINYKPVETDGAARAARQILAVMENRSWASG